MSHLRRSVALLCIGLVVFVAITASVAAELAALLTPLWFVCADAAVRVRRRTTVRRDERLLALLALAPPRAPPAGFDPVSQPSS